jgi:hypothetical protein
LVAGRLCGGGGEGDFDAGVEPFDLADLVAGLAVGVEPVVVVGAEVGVAPGKLARCAVIRPDRKDEPARFGPLARYRQRIEAIIDTLKGQLTPIRPR